MEFRLKPSASIAPALRVEQLEVAHLRMPGGRPARLELRACRAASATRSASTPTALPEGVRAQLLLVRRRRARASRAPGSSPRPSGRAARPRDRCQARAPSRRASSRRGSRRGSAPTQPPSPRPGSGSRSRGSQPPCRAGRHVGAGRQPAECARRFLAAQLEQLVCRSSRFCCPPWRLRAR